VILLFNWVHLWSTRAAFSLFAHGGGWQRYFFKNRHKREFIAYRLILGGTMGNLTCFPSCPVSYFSSSRQP